MTYSNFGHENSDAGRIKWSRGPQVPACFKRTVWIQIWCQRSRRISLRMFTFLPASVKTVIFQITILVFLSSVWLFLALCFFAVTCCVAVLFSIFRARKSILFCFLIQKKRFPCYHFSSNFGARQFAVTRLREWVDPVTWVSWPVNIFCRLQQRQTTCRGWGCVVAQRFASKRYQPSQKVKLTVIGTLVL